MKIWMKPSHYDYFCHFLLHVSVWFFISLYFVFSSGITKPIGILHVGCRLNILLKTLCFVLLVNFTQSHMNTGRIQFKILLTLSHYFSKSSIVVNQFTFGQTNISNLKVNMTILERLFFGLGTNQNNDSNNQSYFVVFQPFSLIFLKMWN